MNNATNAGPSPTALAPGDANGNPAGIDLWSLLVEDFRTQEGKWAAPGFWAIAVHRLGNARMGVRPRLLRPPLSAFYRLAYHAVIALWGIDLPYNVKVGRRLRLMHHGCVQLGAREIGDDVVIRHSATLGLMRRESTSFPSIGNRVEIGPGACIVGGVRIGDDSFIGANSVVTTNLASGSSVLGVLASRMPAG